MREQPHQISALQSRQVHILLWPALDFRAGLFARIYHAPDAPVLAVHALRIRFGVLIAWIFVVPIGDPERAIRANLFADRPEPAIARGQKILVSRRFET